MSATSLWHYFSGIGLDSGDVLSCIDFTNLSGSYFVANLGQNMRLFGNTGQVNAVSGSGYFKSGFGQLDLSDDFVLVSVFERGVSGKQTIFSSLSGVSGNVSGFSFGINDVDKYYIKYFDTDKGYQTKTFNLPIAKKNALTVFKNGASIAISDFNLQDKTGFVDSVVVPITTQINSNVIVFGGISGFASGVSNSFFSGYVDNILLLNQQPDNSLISYGLSGFFSERSGGYLNSFKMDGIVSYLPVETGKTLALNVLNDSGASFNNSVILDYSSGFFKTDVEVSGNQARLFINGIFQNSGYPTGDYAYSGNYFRQSLTWDNKDKSIFDKFSGSESVKEITGAAVYNSGNILFSGVQASLLFLNGQSLISGKEWRISGSHTIAMDSSVSGITGKLVAVNNLSGSLSTNFTGYSLFETGSFNKKTSIVFLDGVRQEYNQQYKEISSFSPLYGFTGFSIDELELIQP